MHHYLLTIFPLLLIYFCNLACYRCDLPSEGNAPPPVRRSNQFAPGDGGTRQKTNHETAARSRGAGCWAVGKAVRGRNRGSPAQEKGATQPNPTDRPNGRKAIKASRGALSSSLLPNNKREENASSSRPRSAATRVPPNLQQAAGAAGPFILPPLRPSSPALPLRAAAAISCGTAPRFSIWGIIVYSLRGIFSGVCVILSVTAAWGLRVLIGGCGVDCS
jgi:hypothetical protein